PASLGLVRDVFGYGFRELGASGRLIVRLEEPRPPPNHLAKGPERDPIAVRRRPSVVEPRRLDEAVDVLAELPGEPRLSDAGGTDDGHEAGSPLARRAMEQVLEQP